MKTTKQLLEEKLLRDDPWMDEHAIQNYADTILHGLDERLVPNLYEWIEGRPISDLWIGEYCVNAIMSIRGDSNFLSALHAMNTYLQDKEAGVLLIWRGRR